MANLKMKIGNSNGKTSLLTQQNSNVKQSATAKNSKQPEPIPATLRMSRRSGEFTLTVRLDQNSIVEVAKQVIARQFKRYSSVLDKPDKVKDFLLLHLAPFEREVFACLFLDNKNRLIAFEPLFYGSIRNSQVNAREVIKRALHFNAAAVIAAHNHPSGHCQPSRQDELITHRLDMALRLSDIRLLDHFVVGSEHVISLVDCGLFKPD